MLSPISALSISSLARSIGEIVGSPDTVVDPMGAFAGSSCDHECQVVSAIERNTDRVISWLALPSTNITNYIGQKIAFQGPLAAALIHDSSKMLFIFDMISINFVSADRVLVTTTQVCQMTEHEFTRNGKGVLYSPTISFQQAESPKVCGAAIEYWVSLSGTVTARSLPNLVLPRNPVCPLLVGLDV